METEDELDEIEHHANRAALEYLKAQPFYSDLSNVIARIVKESLDRQNIKVHSVQARAKDPKSFARKAATPSDNDPLAPKYPEPIKDITDLAGIRIITHFLGTVREVDQILESEFEIVEKSNKGMQLIASDRFGYQSIHYLVRIKSDRGGLAEYKRFDGHIAEIQVRTILQHAWAEIEHDIQYKSSISIPTEIRRRFVALAGMLEIADREFQAIEDANQRIERATESKVNAGDLQGLEITPRALKLFLDKKLGADGRMSDWSYDWTARLLKSLGFRDLREVEAAIAPYDDNELSMMRYGNRQGQLNRFELMLTAALGEQWTSRHPWQDGEWPERHRAMVEGFARRGIDVGTYQVPNPPQPMKR